MENIIKQMTLLDYCKQGNGGYDQKEQNLIHIIDKNMFSQLLSNHFSDDKNDYANQIIAGQYFIVFTNNPDKVFEQKERLPGLYLIVPPKEGLGTNEVNIGALDKIQLVYHNGLPGKYSKWIKLMSSK